MPIVAYSRHHESQKKFFWGRLVEAPLTVALNHRPIPTLPPSLSRVRYSAGNEMKQVDLKCVTMVAKEIVERIEDILNRQNPARLESKMERRKMT